MADTADETAGKASFRVEEKGAELTLLAEGDWSVTNLVEVDGQLRDLPNDGFRDAIIDLSGVTRLDSAGAWLINRTLASLGEKARGTASIEGASDIQTLLLEKAHFPEKSKKESGPPAPFHLFALNWIGEKMREFGREALDTLDFFGSVIRAFAATFRQPTRLRLVPLVHHMQKAGFDALPLVCLLTFLIGAVIAQQGAVQLRKFGAEVFTVNLIAIIFLREVGLLLTAIIVAGRSGSAFTAEIGTMKMRQEIDAMRTLGLDPMDMLILPRILALVLMLPLLTFIADILGLIGGAMVSIFQLGISLDTYINRVKFASTFWTFGVGILKAPFMALAIAVVACKAGLDVSGSAESVGTQTTRSVVRSIFLVIVLDAAFAMFFTAIGI